MREFDERMEWVIPFKTVVTNKATAVLFFFLFIFGDNLKVIYFDNVMLCSEVDGLIRMIIFIV